MKYRLPRRYDSVVRTLNKLMETGNARVQESAAMRLSEIYMEHDRSCERREIAIERAAARVEAARLIAEGKPSPEAPDELSGHPDAIAQAQNDASVKQSVDEYLQRTIGKTA